MKIMKLTLTNFSLIYSAMNKKKITIDFSKSKHRICLLLGENGSGKTSLLSNLHPFPHLGTLDIRNASNLILPGRDGYKEIIIRKDRDMYEIQHFYKYVKDDKWSLKSYIKLNGNELNPTGSVNNFYTIIQDQFNIDYTFLKVIRLGSNVNNIIKLKSTERKEFISSLLSDLDVFGKLYKTVSDKTKKFKTRISVLNDQINSLKIDNISSYEAETNKLKEDLENRIILKNSLEKELWSMENKLKSIAPSIDDLKAEFKKCEKERKKSIPKKDWIRDSDYIDKLNKAILDIKEELLKIDEGIAMYKDSFNKCIERKNKLQNDIGDFRAKKQLVEHSPQIEEIDRMISKYEREIDNIRRQSTQCEYINTTNIRELYDDRDALKKIDDYIEATLNAYDEKVTGLIFTLKDNGYGDDIEEALSSLISDLSKKTRIDETIYRHPDCKIYNECPIYKYTIEHSISSDKYDSKMELLLKAQKFYNAYTTILDMIRERNANSAVDVFYDNKIIDCIFKNRMYNLKLSENDSLIKSISMVEDSDRISELNKNIQKLTEQKDALVKEQNMPIAAGIAVCINELEKVEANLNMIGRNIDDKMYRRALLDDKLDKYTSKLNKYVNFSEVNKKYLNIYADIKKYETLSKNKNYTQGLYDDITKYINELNERIKKRTISEEIYKTSKNELLTIQDVYDKVYVIREALSNTKGIPLLYMQLYFKDIQITANDIISKVYGDRIRLDNFVINDKGFTIPYIVNGIRISDISSASQGEAAVINLAITLSIIGSVSGDYNILLLDEVEGPLSPANKEKFFYILDYQLSKIGAEQVFVISHNKLYESYGCDVILTSPNNDIRNIENVNVIYSV